MVEGTIRVVVFIILPHVDNLWLKEQVAVACFSGSRNGYVRGIMCLSSKVVCGTVLHVL